MVGRYVGPLDDTITDIMPIGPSVNPTAAYPSVPDDYQAQPRMPGYPAPVVERHPERFAQYRFIPNAVAVAAPAGTPVISALTLGFRARTITIFNDADCDLFFPQLMALVKKQTYNVVLRCEPTISDLTVITSSAATNGGNVYIRPSELEQEVGPYGTGAAASSVSITSPIGQKLMALSLSVAIASDQSAVPISAASLPLPANAAQETGGNLASIATNTSNTAARLPTALTGAGWFQVSLRGAANINTFQQTSTAAAATLLAARATRKRAVINNTDAANAVWVGPATVTTGNGMRIGPGQSIEVTWTGLVQIIDNGSHAVITVLDEFD